MTPAGVTLEATINPQNSETNYEFVVTWQTSNPSKSGEPPSESLRAARGGPIPAGAGNVTVSGVLTGLQPGYLYWYEVVAMNFAGETRSHGDDWFNFYYTGGFPEGVGGAPFIPTASSACADEFARQEAERIAAAAEAERHRIASEKEAQLAKEAAELRQHEAEEADVPSVSAPTCTVPTLRGDTLSVARRSIDRAHCRLGKVWGASHRRGALVVLSQSRPDGEKLAGGTAIDLRMGRARPRRHRVG